ncbi:MAG: DinB family protein [Chloroflexi bacterium]|nr:DinB family protein [Chloroflexota bacterium]
MIAKALITSFEYSGEVIAQQVAEISHDESLRQAVAEGHSANWLLGHIVSARSYPLRFVRASPVWSDDERAHYRDGSQAIGADKPGVIDFRTLHEYFDLSQSRLLTGLERMAANEFSAPSGYAANTVFESLLYFHFHETYHVGQLTMVAEALGKRAKYLGS